MSIGTLPVLFKEDCGAQTLGMRHNLQPRVGGQVYEEYSGAGQCLPLCVSSVGAQSVDKFPEAMAQVSATCEGTVEPWNRIETWDLCEITEGLEWSKARLSVVAKLALGACTSQQNLTSSWNMWGLATVLAPSTEKLTQSQKTQTWPGYEHFQRSLGIRVRAGMEWQDLAAPYQPFQREHS